MGLINQNWRIDFISRVTLMKMHYLIYDAQPKANSDKAKEFGGAYVSCWIMSDNLEEANLIAKGMISEQGWVNITLDEGYEIDESHYKNKKDGLEYYRQALIDKEVLVFHTYPIEE